jgi:hypothetical protein
MNALLNYFGHGLAFAAGITTASFCLIQAFICLFFALPLTMRLKKDFAFVGRPPTLRYVVAPIFLGSLFVLASWAMHAWFPSRMTAYWIGVGWVVIFGLRQCFGTSTNMAEYIGTNESVLLPNVVDEIRSGTYSR